MVGLETKWVHSKTKQIVKVYNNYAVDYTEKTMKKTSKSNFIL